MALNGNGKQGQGAMPGTAYPIARAFALLVIAALAALIILRHLFGSIRVDVGTR